MKENTDREGDRKGRERATFGKQTKIITDSGGDEARQRVEENCKNS